MSAPAVSVVDWQQGNHLPGRDGDSILAHGAEVTETPPRSMRPVVVGGYDLRDTINTPLSVVRGIVERYLN